jgi:hypothetical protein
MPKLTKTEARIYEYLQRKGRYGACASDGHGAEGGKIHGGQREFYACLKLVKRGLAVQVGDIHRHTVYRRGWGEYCSEVVIRLPEKENQQ